MKTTLQEMLEHIKSRKWNISYYGAIRCESNLCPIVAAAQILAHDEFEQEHGDWTSDSFRVASTLIGLTVNPYTFIEAVDQNEQSIRAAYEYFPSKCSQLIRIRRRVVKALGLTDRQMA